MASDSKADCTALKDLLLWARDHKIRLDAITVGSVTVSAIDHTLGEKIARRQAKNDDIVPERDALRRWGGRLLDEAEGMANEVGLEEDDEEQLEQ